MAFLTQNRAIARRTSLGIACLLLTACASAPGGGGEDAVSDSSGEAGDRLQVVTTFLPVTQFTNAVAGSCAEVTQLLPSNVGPHDYQAKPTDAQLLSQADVLVQNGLELEQFLEPIIEGAGSESLLIVETSAGLPLLESAGHGDDHGDDHAGHDHGDEHGDEEHGDEEHGDESAKAGSHGHNHGEFDPHVWLDPVLAVDQVNNIRDGLIAAAPDCEAEFTANAAAFNEQLRSLDQEFQQALSPYAGQTFVTYHDFATYFSDRYNLEARSLVRVPEENPSPSDVQEVMEVVETSDLKTLLVDSETSGDPFRSLAQDLNVSISTFRPNEVGDSSDPEAYLAVMRENVANLQAAFGIGN